MIECGVPLKQGKREKKIEIIKRYCCCLVDDDERKLNNKKRNLTTHALSYMNKKSVLKGTQHLSLSLSTSTKKL